jgi:hypothetical protein
MNEEPAHPPELPAEAVAGPGEPGEHPLSVLLFAWMRRPMVARYAMICLGVIGVGLIGAEWLISPHRIKDATNVPGFYGVFGFIAFAIAVLSGWPLSKLLRRPEDYYDKRSGEAGRDR